MSRKKQCIIIGICQSGAIAQILDTCPEFTAQYTIVDVVMVHQTSTEQMESILRDLIPRMDLVLSQPVSSNYQGTDVYSTARLLGALGPSTRHIILSNAYFSGYDPVPFQPHTGSGEILSGSGISYFPSILTQALHENNVKLAAKRWCDPYIYSKKQCLSIVNGSLDELSRREADIFGTGRSVDVKITDYIRDNYQKDLLFHTYNHPTNKLLIHMTDTILFLLGIQHSPICIEKELLGDVSIPPPVSVYISLECGFPYPQFKFGDRYMGTKDAIWKLYLAFHELPEDVQAKSVYECLVIRKMFDEKHPY